MVSRIKQLLDWQQLSPTQFADRIGIGRPVISHILSERNKPSLDVMRSIKAAFPEVSTDWLLDGIGTMLVAAPAPTAAPVSPPPRADFAAQSPPPLTTPVSTPAAVQASVLAVADAPAPAEPVRPVAVPIVAPRPAIARFAPGKVEKAVQALPSTPPLAPHPVENPIVAAELPLPAPAPSPLPTAVEAAPAVPPVATPAPAPAPAMPSLAEVFGEPGKAIRRIVIFYRDGSFADYQPEG